MECYGSTSSSNPSCTYNERYCASLIYTKYCNTCFTASSENTFSEVLLRILLVTSAATRKGVHFDDTMLPNYTANIIN